MGGCTSRREERKASGGKKGDSACSAACAGGHVLDRSRTDTLWLLQAISDKRSRLPGGTVGASNLLVERIIHW
jgi:hypothetical protein